MKKLIPTTLILGFAMFAQAQTVTYDIPFSSTQGLDMTSGDICTAPFNVEEIKQTQMGNTWGFTWISTNTGTPSSVELEITFSINEAALLHTYTLNGGTATSWDTGLTGASCGSSSAETFTLDPADYVSMGQNTVLFDYSNSTIINQIDNLPYAGDPYMRVTVEYSGAGINELTGEEIELVKITDLMGRETSFQSNIPLIYVYSDGSVNRIFVAE